MRRVISASRRVRNMGAVPVFGFTRAKSEEANAKQRFGSLMVSISCRKKAHSVSVEPPLRAAEYQGAELEPGVHIGEEGRQPCSESPVLEVEQALLLVRYWKGI